MPWPGVMFATSMNHRRFFFRLFLGLSAGHGRRGILIADQERGHQTDNGENHSHQERIMIAIERAVLDNGIRNRLTGLLSGFDG